MCSCSHAISAKEKSSTGTQQMAKSRKRSLVIPKTRYQFRIFRLLCVMDLISSVLPISPSNKVRHGPFGACSGIFRHNLFTKSCFHCIVYKLPLIFLVFGTLSFNFFLQRLPLWHLTLCGTFVARLGPLSYA